ncbi:MAG: 5-methylcytosine-specific restriction enzyme [Methanoculleus sp.]|nr:5-methylcytosine-specific restriction enzyme [Methanoculleus sp.]
MGRDLDTRFSQLLEAIAKHENTTVEMLGKTFASDEIANRRTFYPQLKQVLSGQELNLNEFKGVIKNCWAATAKIEFIRFTRFTEKGQPAIQAIQTLIKDFPPDDAEAAVRIDAFIDEAIQLGYKDVKDSPDRPGAAALCSVLLTSLFPDRFVDFKQRRWKKFAQTLDYNVLYPGDGGYGQGILWAGNFAASIAETMSFRRVWRVEYPLWALAGIAWKLPDLKQTPDETKGNSNHMPDISEDAEITTLLAHKKQVILYGPPGTGKTYRANNYISHLNAHDYEVHEDSLLDQRIFSLTIYEPRDGPIPDLSPGTRFIYGWKERRNWQTYYDELQEGDVALAYNAAKLRRFTTVVRCTQKETDSIEFEVVQQFNGPSYEDMKSDPGLKESDLMRIQMAFSLKLLKHSELQRIIALSEGLTYESLGIELKRIRESIPNKEFVTFHPSFGYEDFVEGLRPLATDDGTLAYRVEDGIFKTLSRRAFNVLAERARIEERWNESESIPDLDDAKKKELLKVVPEVPFYLVIDEINRGDISRIFGELITLLEADKRYCEEHGIVITLPYSKEKYAIPPNLYIIGTMNTADKSISLVDAALRRRFGFIEMMPDYNVLRNLPDDKDEEVREIVEIAMDALETINKRITGNYDRDHRIGHSYLIKLRDACSQDEALEMLHFAWYHEIVPLLQEYYYDAPARFNEVIGSRFVKLSPDERGFDIRERLYGDELFMAVEGLANGNREQEDAEADE